MNSRCLLIGLDGGTFTILDPLMEEGVMPFLKRFVASGARGGLRSVFPPSTPPAWTSITTGRSPVNHGVFEFLTFETPDRRYVRLTDSTDVRCETIWSMVSRNGLTATALNFPLMAPPRPISGCVIPGWVLWRFLRPYCYPPGLYERLKRDLPSIDWKEFGLTPDLRLVDLLEKSQEELERRLGFYLRRERQWFQVLAYLMQTEPHHLTGSVFDGVDMLQHLFWGLLDPGCLSRQLSFQEEKLRQLCLDYFRQLDGFLAEIVALSGDDVNIFIVSDHGFGSSSEVCFCVNAWLRQNGYLEWAGSGSEGQEKSGTGALSLRLTGWLDRPIDWSRTTAYALTPTNNGIHICVAGRRGNEGIPPEEYPVFRQKLADALRRFRDPETGEPIVVNVLTQEEAFPGKFMHLAPDLMLVLKDGWHVSTRKSDILIDRRPGITGGHRMEGVFLARGPAVASAALLSEISVLDVTPILLYALGLSVPEDLEGRVRTEVFQASYVQNHPVIVGAPSQTLEAFPPLALESEAEEQIMARLKALGYLE